MFFCLFHPSILKLKQRCIIELIHRSLSLTTHTHTLEVQSPNLILSEKKDVFPVKYFTSCGSMMWRTGGFGFGSSGWRTLSRSVAIASSSIADTWSLSTIQYSWSNYKKSLNKLVAELSWVPFIWVDHTLYNMKTFLNKR